MPLVHDSFPATRLILGRMGAVLFVGLLLLGGTPLVQSAGGSTTVAASPHLELLASNTTTFTVTGSISTQPLPFSLAGIWEDNSGSTCTDCTYSVSLTSLGSNVFFLAVWYQTDPTCPAAVGSEFINVDIGSNGSSLNDAPGFTFMTLCTRASNPIVQDCDQPALWTTTYNLTVTQNSITGEYLSQYWTWDTATNGAITNCMLDYNFSQPFTLTPVFNSTSLSSGATTPQQQNTGTTNLSPVQTSSRSTTNFSSTTTSTHSGASGHLYVEILAAAAVLVVAAAVSVFFLRKRP